MLYSFGAAKSSIQAGGIVLLLCLFCLPLFAEDFPPPIPILTYHDISPDTADVMSPAVFASQLDFLVENDFQTITATEYVRILKREQSIPRRAVVITFDDHHPGTVRYGVPLLKERGMRGTFFVTVKGIYNYSTSNRLSWSELRTTIDDGVLEIQSHSYEHIDLTQADLETIELNMTLSREKIESNLGTECTLFAYPYGAFDWRCKSLASSLGYEAAFTLGLRRFDSAPMDFYELHRVNMWEGMDRNELHWRSNLDLLPPLPSFIERLSWQRYR